MILMRFITSQLNAAPSTAASARYRAVKLVEIAASLRASRGVSVSVRHVGSRSQASVPA